MSWDVAIIGAGVVGTAIARELAGYQLRCVLLEAAVTLVRARPRRTRRSCTPASTPRRERWRAAWWPGAARCCGSTRSAPGSPSNDRGAAGRLDAGAGGAPDAIAGNRGQRVYPHPFGTRRRVYQREPGLGPGAACGRGFPTSGSSTPGRSRSRSRRRRARGRGAAVREPGHRGIRRGRRRRVRAGHAAAAAPVRCRFAVNAAGLASDAVDRLFGGGGFTIRPRKGELIVYDKLARPLLSSIILPVPTARTRA